MQFGRVERWHVKFLARDQESDLGAAEDHAIRALVPGVGDDLEIALFGRRQHLALAELIVDYVVDDRSLRCIGYAHDDAVFALEVCVPDAAMYEAKQKRNSWIGIEGLAWDESGDALYEAIKSDPGKLAEDGVIRAVESLEDAAENYA